MSGGPVSVDEIALWVVRVEEAAAADDPVVVDDPGFAGRTVDPAADVADLERLSARLAAAIDTMSVRRDAADVELRRLATQPR